MLNKGHFIKKLGEVLESEEKKLEEKKSEITKDTQEDGEPHKDSKNFQYENLSLIFTIFKNIFYLADQNIIELLLNDDNYLITFGALECKFLNNYTVIILSHRLKNIYFLMTTDILKISVIKIL